MLCRVSVSHLDGDPKCRVSEWLAPLSQPSPPNLSRTVPASTFSVHTFLSSLCPLLLSHIHDRYVTSDEQSISRIKLKYDLADDSSRHFRQFQLPNTVVATTSCIARIRNQSPPDSFLGVLVRNRTHPTSIPTLRLRIFCLRSSR